MVLGRQQTRREQREKEETDEGQTRRQGQRVAHEPVSTREPEEQDQHDGDHRHEMRRPVVIVAQADELPIAQKPVLDRLFVKDAQVPLQADDPVSVGGGLELRHRFLASDVPNHAVEEVEGRDDQHLAPPVGSLDRAGGVRLGGLKRSHGRAHQLGFSHYRSGLIYLWPRHRRGTMVK